MHRVHSLFVYFFSLFALLFSTSCIFSAQSVSYDQLVIGLFQIEIVNSSNTVCDPHAIQARLKSQAGALFSHAAFDEDLKTLSEEFDRIEPTIDRHEDRIDITLRLWPKPMIRKIQWIGNEKISTKKLQDELDFSLDAPFDRRAFTQAFHKLKTYYVRKGFFEAQLRYEIIFSENSGEIDLLIFIDEGRSGRIKRIEFVNFTLEEENEILSNMLTKEYFPIWSWFNEDGTYREELIQEDELTILNYLQNKGYADAQVTIKAWEVSDDRIVVTITAIKGDFYDVDTLSFEGHTLFSNEEICNCFSLYPGSPYSPEEIRNTISRITQIYGRIGYLDAFVDYEIKSGDHPCSYKVNFKIEEGQQFRVGLIKVFGNCITQTRVILNETTLIPGEIFNLNKLKITEARLQNIGYFKNVNVYTIKSDSCSELGANYRDVHIEVEETSTGSFGAFFGFSTLEQLFGGFNITENNFNSAGLPYLFQDGAAVLRGGGEFLHFQTTIGSRSRSYVLSWTKPYFMDTQWVVGFDIDRSSNRYISENYDIETTGLKLKGLYQLNPFLKTGCHYRLKYTQFHVDVSSSSGSHDSSSNSSPSSSEAAKKAARESGLISAVGASLIYDSTNNPLKPSNGYKSRLEGEWVGLGGRSTFFSFGYINSYYWQLLPWDDKGVWRLRWDLRFLQPYGNTSPETIPIDERLFLGGETTIRGYRPYRLGPGFTKDDPEGGISMQLLSLEYAFPVWGPIELFTFADAGYLSLKPWHFGAFQTAVGYGVRLGIFPNSPPLVLGWGFPLNPKDSSEVKKFFLSLGGQF